MIFMYLCKRILKLRKFIGKIIEHIGFISSFFSNGHDPSHVHSA